VPQSHLVEGVVGVTMLGFTMRVSCTASKEETTL
jgi:hypothetical protein